MCKVSALNHFIRPRTGYLKMAIFDNFLEMPHGHISIKISKFLSKNNFVRKQLFSANLRVLNTYLTVLNHL